MGRKSKILAEAMAVNVLLAGGGFVALEVMGRTPAAYMVDQLGDMSGQLTGLGFEYGGATEDAKILPPTAQVQRYTAYITGKASADFTVEGTHTSLCHTKLTNRYVSVGTIAVNTAQVEIGQSADNKTVDVNLKQAPKIEDPGFDLSDTESQVDDNFLTQCGVGIILGVQEHITPVAQANADTISDCIAEKPEFRQSFEQAMKEFATKMHPGATTVNVNMPAPDIELKKQHQENLKRIRDENSQGGYSIKASSTDNCTFEDFKVINMALDDSKTDEGQR